MPNRTPPRTSRRHEPHLETTFGTVQVERLSYASPGRDSLHPLNAALNLPPRALLAQGSQDSRRAVATPRLEPLHRCHATAPAADLRRNCPTRGTPGPIFEQCS